MSLQMIDAKERKIASESQGFAHSETDQQRSCQPWSIGGRHSINILPITASLLQRHLNDRNNGGQLLAGCNFWHNTTITIMNRALRCHYIRANVAAILHQRSSS